MSVKCREWHCWKVFAYSPMTDYDTVVSCWLVSERYVHDGWENTVNSLAPDDATDTSEAWGNLNTSSKMEKSKGNQCNTLFCIFSSGENVHYSGKKNPLKQFLWSAKAKENISSKVGRNMDANDCFSDAEATVKSMLFKKHNIVEVNHFFSALETNLI